MGNRSNRCECAWSRILGAGSRDRNRREKGRKKSRISKRSRRSNKKRSSGDIIGRSISAGVRKFIDIIRSEISITVDS